MFKNGMERLKEKAASFYPTAEPQPSLLGREAVLMLTRRAGGHTEERVQMKG